MMGRIVMNSLFGEPEGIKPGQEWTDLFLEKENMPNPMTRVKVLNTYDGMVKLCSAAFGSSGTDICISPATLRKNYRLEQEG